MKLVVNLLVTFGLMLVLLLAVGLLGGVGTVELVLWSALLVVVLAVVARRSSRPGRGPSS
jgi:hypothetical protein